MSDVSDGEEAKEDVFPDGTMQGGNYGLNILKNHDTLRSHWLHEF